MIRCCSIAVLLVFPLSSWAASPNVILIVADDLGYANLSIQGCKEFQTPNIDSIARNGVRFEQGYVCNSVCAPSRAGLMSGRIGIGFESNLPKDHEHGLDANLETMADLLKNAGYRTSCIGKWHLGSLDKYYPTNRGFDYFCGLRGGSRSYFYDVSGSDSPGNLNGIEINGRQITFQGYLTDFLTDKAIEVIEAYKRQPDSPFFLYLSYTAPHAPMHAKPEIIKRYKHIANKKRRIYAAMMDSLDEGVGRVLQCLEKHSLDDNTLLVFLSDNGGPTFKNGSSNSPLRGRKGSVWEGGMRVPFLVQWPSRIPSGQVLDKTVISLDLLPTFAAVAGVKPVADANGMNLMPYLTGVGKTISERNFYWRRDNMKDCAFRSGRFKWVNNRNKNQIWLFDLEKDVSEENNLIENYPEVAERMRSQYVQWESTVSAPLFSSGWTAKMEAQDRREQEAYEANQR